MLLSPCKKVPASVSDVICNQIWSPYLNWVSIEGKRFHISLWTGAAVHLIRTTSADYSAVLLQECVRELSWPNRPMNKEKKYLPVRGAVNFPVCKFMAPPTLFNRSISNGMEVFVWFVRSCVRRLDRYNCRRCRTGKCGHSNHFRFRKIRAFPCLSLHQL